MMNFIKELSKIKREDDISVYWVDGWMYVNDESENQAVTPTKDLFGAYIFAILIRATYFDYTASDEEVKKLSEQMLDLVDEEWYKINVWEYIDDIANDFEALTNIKLDINDKRAIVCHMTEMDDGYDLTCSFGSATYLAKLLWRYIKGDDKIKKQNGEQFFKGCDNKQINELADKYLQSDNYDLNKFAQELHKITNYTIPINGSLWVNCAKYEYVDKIIITNEEVDIYWNDNIIGNILKENIKSFIQQNYEQNITKDMSYLFNK